MNLFSSGTLIPYGSLEFINNVGLVEFGFCWRVVVKVGCFEFFVV